MSKRIIKTFFVLLLGVITSMQAQEKQIKGTILDEIGTPLPGASVTIKGTSKGDSTDFDGNFTVTAKSTDILVMTFMGYITQEVKVGNQSTINVILKADIAALDEVIIVGFGTQKKANVTGAVTSVNLDDVLGDRPITNSAVSLQGVIPGLQVVANSGEPGSEGVGINIRGFTSINGGSPLILVDNVPVSMSDINPKDIKTVTVLKDAAASSIYGARAAFGVILITTKKPEIGKSTFNYSVVSSFSRPTETPIAASPLEFVTALNDWGRDSFWSRGQDTAVWKDLLEQYESNPAAYPEGKVEVAGIVYDLKENDHIGNLFNDVGFTQIHNVSYAGGTEKTSYRVSMGYSSEDGIMVTNRDAFKRYNVSSFVKTELVKNLTASINTNYRNSNKSNPRADYGGSIKAPSFLSTGIFETFDGALIPYDDVVNVLKENVPGQDDNRNLRLFGKLEYKPLKNLTVVGEYTYETKDREIVNVNISPVFISQSTLDILGGDNDATSYRNTRRNSVYKGINLYAKYEKSIKDAHNFALLAGYNSEEQDGSSLTIYRPNLISTGLPSIPGATGVIDGGQSFYQWAVSGVFGRLNYNYKEKYFLEINGRYDGSSRFASEDRFGFFPSFSAGWNITKESFMESQKIFSNLKFRGSWGEVGNQIVKFGNGAQNYYPSILGVETYDANWLSDGGTRYLTLADPGLLSDGFTWETIRTTNFGLDMAVLNNRLSLALDIYKRETLDMIISGAELPAVLGTSAPVANAADLESTGWELDMSWRDNIGKDFSYQIGVNLYDNQAKITKFDNEEGLLSQYYVGRKIGEIWGYETDGYYTEADFEPGSLSEGLTGGTLLEGIPSLINRSPNPGDIKYKDLDGDGSINNGNNTLYAEFDENGDFIARTGPGDRKIIGNSNRRYQYGMYLRGAYKNFDFSVHVNGVGKRDLVLNSDTFWAFRGQFDNIFKHQLDYWTPANTDAYYPRNYGSDNSNYGGSRNTQTKYLQDGSYLNIKNISIGYTLPKEKLEKLSVNNLRIFFSGENLSNFDDLPSGLHPEFANKGRGAAYPYQRKFSVGINLSL